jgi:hypothetical protein
LLEKFLNCWILVFFVVDVVMSMILTMPLNEQKEVLTRLTQLLNEK